MPEEFEGDLAGAVFWGADLRGARFRDVDLTGVAISHARVVDVEIDADVRHLIVNGVDVTAFVNERDPWYPLRSMLRPASPAAFVESWNALEASWGETTERALARPEAARHRSVDGEWSFVQTVRHLVFAIDKWCTVPLLAGSFHPMGLPNSGSIDFPWPGLDRDADPSSDEALAVLADRTDRLRSYLATLVSVDLDGPVDVLENGPHPRSECLFTVFEEVFWHNRYARRDLASVVA